MSNRIIALAVCGVVVFGAAGHARQGRDTAPLRNAPAGTGVISGTLASLDGGRAVRRARVVLSGGDQRVSKSATTDDQGVFSFTELGPGDYTLTANKAGYLDVIYGQRYPGTGRPGTPIHLDAGQKLDRIALRIPRGAVITGTVKDEAGEPAFGTQVRALRYVLQSGERTLRSAGGATADDRGVYRIGVLPPGEYVIVAQPREELAMVEEAMMRVEQAAVAAKAAGNLTALSTIMDDAKLSAIRSATEPSANPLTTGYAAVYYPGTLQGRSAQSVTVAIGEERGNIDLQLQLVPTSRVSGMVLGLDAGSPGAMIQIVDQGQPPGFGVTTVRAGADGRFTAMGLAPGQYTLMVRTTNPQTKIAQAAAEMMAAGARSVTLEQTKAAAAAANTANRWGMTEITVDGRELSNVTVTLQEGMSISGHVVFESAGAAPDLTRLSLALVPAGVGEVAGVPPAAVDANGRFTIRGVTPGKYRIVPSAGVPAGYQIKSSVFAGRDTLDFPIEVKPGEDRTAGVLTFSTRSAEISGTLQDQGGQPAPDYTVVLFAADPQYWTPQSRRISGLRPSTQGRFSFKALPAGDYRLVAVTDVEPGQWFDPEFLRQLVAASIPLTVADGEKKTQDVRVR